MQSPITATVSALPRNITETQSGETYSLIALLRLVRRLNECTLPEATEIVRDGLANGRLVAANTP